MCQTVPECCAEDSAGRIPAGQRGGQRISDCAEVEIEDLSGTGSDSRSICPEIIGRYVSGTVVIMVDRRRRLHRQRAVPPDRGRIGAKQLIIVDIYENNAYDIRQELKAESSGAGS